MPLTTLYFPAQRVRLDVRYNQLDLTHGKYSHHRVYPQRFPSFFKQGLGFTRSFTHSCGETDKA